MRANVIYDGKDSEITRQRYKFLQKEPESNVINTLARTILAGSFL